MQAPLQSPVGQRIPQTVDDDRDFTQYARPRRDRRLPARFRTGDFVSIDTPCAPACARLLAPDFAHTHPTLPLNDEEPTTYNNDGDMQQLNTPSIPRGRAQPQTIASSNASANRGKAKVLKGPHSPSTTPTTGTHLPDSSDFLSNTDNIDNPNIDNIAHTSNAANADTNNSNGKSNANNAVGIIDTSSSNDPAIIITVARALSMSERLDTVNSSSTDIIRTAPGTTASDDEPEHEHARILLLNTSHQAPPFAAPQLDRPEEPPSILF